MRQKQDEGGMRCIVQDILYTADIKDSKCKEADCWWRQEIMARTCKYVNSDT